MLKSIRNPVPIDTTPQRPKSKGDGTNLAVPTPGLIVWLAMLCGVVVAILPTAAFAQAKPPVAKIELKATAFTAGGNIPKKFTCDGADISPALSWADPPTGTQSFALIMDDPDAPSGTFVHWVVYNLPASTRELPERVPGNGELSGGGWQGINDFPMTGYGGPCPPRGAPHRYFFKLYALDSKLTLKAGARKQDVEQAMKGHILAGGELMGRYGR